MKLDPHFGMLPIGAFEHIGDRRIRLHGGGGGIPIVSDVVDVVEDIAGGAVDIVDDAVSTVGDAVENVVEKAAETIDNTVTAALDDPVNTAIRVAAYASAGPAGLAAANAAISLGQGQSLEDVATNAAITFAAAQAGSEFSKSLTPEFGSAAANVAGQTASTVVRGGDPLQALIGGGLNAGVSAVASEIPGYDEMSKVQRETISRAITAELQGKDPSQALINAAIGAGVNAAKSADFGSAPSTELTNQVVPETPTYAPDPFEVPEDMFVPTEQDTSDFYQSIGINPESLSNTPAQEEDPLAFLNAPGYYDEITGKFIYDENGQLQAPLDDTSGTNLDSMEGYTTKDGVTTGPDGETYDLSYLPESSYTPLDTSKLAGTPKPDTSYGDAVTKFLNSQISELKPGSGVNPLLAGGAGLAALSALSNSGSKTGTTGGTTEDPYTFNNDPYGNQNLTWDPKTGQLVDGRAYGLEQLNPQFSPAAQFDDAFSTVNAAAGGLMHLARGGVAQYPAAKIDGNEFVLAAQTHGLPDDIGTLNKIASLVNQGMSPEGAAQRIAKSMRPTNMAAGGISSLGGYAAGGNPRLLRGPGDGMSDNIPATIANKQPARLADGEFVVPADVVSHLGNGSTQAGANVLSQMMSRVRKARTGNAQQGKQIQPQKFIPRKGK